VILIR